MGGQSVGLSHDITYIYLNYIVLYFLHPHPYPHQGKQDHTYMYSCISVIYHRLCKLYQESHSRGSVYFTWNVRVHVDRPTMYLLFKCKGEFCLSFVVKY